MSAAWLTPDRIREARKMAAVEGVALVIALERVSAQSRPVFMTTVAMSLRRPCWSDAQLFLTVPLFDQLGFAEAMQRNAIIVRDIAGVTTAVLADPFDINTERWLREQAGWTVPLVWVHPEDMAAYLHREEEKPQAMDAVVMGKAASDLADDVIDISLARLQEDASPVVRLVNSTLFDALKSQASDIHLETDATQLQVKYRIDGVLQTATQISGRDLADQVISRVKVLADLDIAERRIPQDGRFKVRANDREVDFRVSIMPNIFGEDAVIRLLDRGTLTQQAELRLAHLGFSPEIITQINDLALSPYGMLLVTGPTGSGKTTTLYAAISEIQTGRDKIATIEDPVEYRLPGVLQIPVNEKKGLSFARGLRSLLRHDPDKIMVGEIRDNETAQIAVQAALTGHLVFTTVHANNVFDVLGRFLHMEVDPYSLASALNGIVAQRLLRVICPHCAEPYVPSEPLLRRLQLAREDTGTPKQGRGCGQCRGTGYKGRRAIAEILVMTDSIRELIASKQPIRLLKEEAARNGTLPLRAAALAMARAGVTTYEEVVRVTL